MAASKTAQYVALYRALETVERGREPLFHDPFAVTFLPRRYRAAITMAARLPGAHAALSRYADRRAPGARTSAIARTRFIDEAVRRAVVSGVEQCVLLGAGFDCRFHRLQELAPATVFEVDRPETQARKRALLERTRGPVRHDVHYVPVNFLHDDMWACLSRAGFDEKRSTFYVWEGVTNYLTEDAVANVLRRVGAAKSTVVFTYVHAGLLDGTVAFDGGETILGNVRKLAEPWTFGLRPEDVASFLARFGLKLVEDLGADDYRARYLPPARGEPKGYRFYRIAVATTG